MSGNVFNTPAGSFQLSLAFSVGKNLKVLVQKLRVSQK
jgi:hypothetical protein